MKTMCQCFEILLGLLDTIRKCSVSIYVQYGLVAATVITRLTRLNVSDVFGLVALFLLKRLLHLFKIQNICRQLTNFDLIVLRYT